VAVNLNIPEFRSRFSFTCMLTLALAEMDVVKLPELNCSHCGVPMRCYVGDDDGQIFWQCFQCRDILTWGQWRKGRFDSPSAAAEEDPPEPAATTSSVGASSSAGAPLQSEEEQARASRKQLVEIKVAYICALCKVLGIVPEDEGMTAWTDEQISTTMQQLKKRLEARSDTA
jgi:hypothetical protein